MKNDAKLIRLEFVCDPDEFDNFFISWPSGSAKIKVHTTKKKGVVTTIIRIRQRPHAAAPADINAPCHLRSDWKKVLKKTLRRMGSN